MAYGKVISQGIKKVIRILRIRETKFTTDIAPETFDKDNFRSCAANFEMEYGKIIL